MNQSEFYNHELAMPKLLLVNQWIMDNRAGYKTDKEKQVSTEITNRPRYKPAAADALARSRQQISLTAKYLCTELVTILK
jgi:hypothetical protein